LLLASATPTEAQEDPLVEELATILQQIEAELVLVGAPEQTIDWTRQALIDSPATGLDREIFISNLGEELAAVVEDEVALQACLDAVDTLVAQYQLLLEGE
jgi:hypothetical protein